MPSAPFPTMTSWGFEASPIYLYSYLYLVPVVTRTPPGNKCMTLEQRETVTIWALQTEPHTAPYTEQTQGSSYYYTCVQGGKDPHIQGQQEQRGPGPNYHCRLPLGDEASCPFSWRPWRRHGELFRFFPWVQAGRKVSTALTSYTRWLQTLGVTRDKVEVLGL